MVPAQMRLTGLAGKSSRAAHAKLRLASLPSESACSRGTLTAGCGSPAPARARVVTIGANTRFCGVSCALCDSVTDSTLRDRCSAAVGASTWAITLYRPTLQVTGLLTHSLFLGRVLSVCVCCSVAGAFPLCVLVMAVLRKLHVALAHPLRLRIFSCKRFKLQDFCSLERALGS
jgi:hypothetical protein